MGVFNPLTWAAGLFLWIPIAFLAGSPTAAMWLWRGGLACVVLALVILAIDTVLRGPR